MAGRFSYLGIVMLCAQSACGGSKIGAALSRPIASVDAKDAANRDAASMRIGEVLVVKLIVYTPSNASFDDPGVNWLSRNPGIASVAGSRVTAQGAGLTYVVGEIADEGKVFRDSIQVTVLP